MLRYKVAERVNTIRELQEVTKYLSDRYGLDAKVLSYDIEIEDDNGLVFTLSGEEEITPNYKRPNYRK